MSLRLSRKEHGFAEALVCDALIHPHDYFSSSSSLTPPSVLPGTPLLFLLLALDWTQSSTG